MVITEEAVKEAENMKRKKGPPPDVIWTTVTAFIGIAALPGGVEDWFWKKTTVYERIPLLLVGLMLVYPKPLYDFIGFVLIAFVMVSQKLRKSQVAYGL